MSDIADRIRQFGRTLTFHSDQMACEEAAREIERLNEAKCRALKIADERAIEANGLRDRLVQAERRIEKAADCIPATWLDPLLSGPGNIGQLPFNGAQIEALLQAIRKRITALTSTDRADGGQG